MKIKHVLILAASLVLVGCATAIAVSITSVSEVAASNLLQKKVLNVTQLSTLAADLQKLPATPLPSSDNGVIANVVTELLTRKAASLTQESVVDALNHAIAALNTASSTSPNALQGIAWADLQDVVGGLNQAVVNVNQNPSLAPQ